MLILLFFSTLSFVTANTQHCCDANIMKKTPGYELLPLPPLERCPGSVHFVCSGAKGSPETSTHININGNKTVAFGFGEEHSVTYLICRDRKWISTVSRLIVNSISCECC